jgi:hypothetical protein
VKPICLFFAILLASVSSPSRGEVIDAAGLKLTIPTGWRSEQPASSMRAAQVVVPGAGGEGQLTVFHFGAGGGGGVDSNLDRWLSQVVLDPGAGPKREVFDTPTPSMKVHLVDASGTVTASRVGSFPAQDQPGWRLLGAVLEAEGGPWYLRLVGPKDTLEAQRDAFLKMLRTATR